MNGVTIEGNMDELKIVFPSLLCYLEKVIGYLVDFLEQMQCGVELFSLRLVLFEALTNAVVHGNRSDESLKVTIETKVSNGLLKIVVSDEGDGFDWRSKIKDTVPLDHLSSGRGLIILRTYEYFPTYNDIGNVLSLEKRLEQVEDIV